MAEASVATLGVDGAAPLLAAVSKAGYEARLQVEAEDARKVERTEQYSGHVASYTRVPKPKPVKDFTQIVELFDPKSVAAGQDK